MQNIARSEHAQLICALEAQIATAFTNSVDIYEAAHDVVALDPHLII